MSTSIEDIASGCKRTSPIETKALTFIRILAQKNHQTKTAFDADYTKWMSKLHFILSKVQLREWYQKFLAESKVARSVSIETFCVIKSSRGASGVTVITSMLSPYPEDENGVKREFSCAYDCHYCPNESRANLDKAGLFDAPAQPRSYLSTECVDLRAMENDFCPMGQFLSRLNVLKEIGHTPDKIEYIILGGTFDSFPKYYQEKFICETFYIANCPDRSRPMMTIQEERRANRDSKVHIIGVTIETRPDQISMESIARYRKYGVTRVQLGVQHTDDTILKKIGRQSTTRRTIRAIRLLKNNGFKVDIHLMPDLPFSDPEIDRKMFDRVISDPELQADQWKIYPCQILNYTKIKEWYDAGEYKPYAEKNIEDLIDLIIHVKTSVPEWIRFNRIIRDFPQKSVLGGVSRTDLRGVIHQRLKERGLECNCIRCHEPGRDIYDKSKVVIKNTVYDASCGTEHFITAELPKLDDKDHPDYNPTRRIFGFIRLRFPTDAPNGEKVQQLPELENAALIRELHVYGNVVSVDGKDRGSSQHSGFGSILL